MKNLKSKVYNIIRDDQENSLAAKIFSSSILFLIIINVLIVILDTFSGLPSWCTSVFRYIEIGSVVIFTIEYLLRIWTATLIYPDKASWAARIKFATSFMGLVDLFAISPFYLPLLIPFDLRVLRMIRLLRLLRILKVNRYTSALSTIGRVIRRQSSQLISSMVVVFLLLIMASVIMYSVENEKQPEVFQNAFSGLWWAIETLTTVGYGDIYPVTALGKILSSIIALLGIALVAVPTGIISAGFMEEISIRKSEVKSNHICQSCKKEISKS